MTAPDFDDRADSSSRHGPPRSGRTWTVTRRSGARPLTTALVGTLRCARTTGAFTSELPTVTGAVRRTVPGLGFVASERPGTTLEVEGAGVGAEVAVGEGVGAEVAVGVGVGDGSGVGAGPPPPPLAANVVNVTTFPDAAVPVRSVASTRTRYVVEGDSPVSGHVTAVVAVVEPSWKGVAATTVPLAGFPGLGVIRQTIAVTTSFSGVTDAETVADVVPTPLALAVLTEGRDLSVVNARMVGDIVVPAASVANRPT